MVVVGCEVAVFIYVIIYKFVKGSTSAKEINQPTALEMTGNNLFLFISSNQHQQQKGNCLCS
jgi:hypothetical protein